MKNNFFFHFTPNIVFFVHCPLIIIIMMMIKNIIKNHQTAIRSFFTIKTYRFSSEQITPPSQLEMFKQHIFNIQDRSSFEKAADLMAQLQTDKETYIYKIEELKATYKQFQQTNPETIDIINRRKLLQSDIKDQINQNILIESRMNKQLQNVKIYGIYKIAKEIVEVSDHIKIALSMIEKSRTEIKQEEKVKLQELYQNLLILFKKYHIEEFNPINETFDPNLHESFGQILIQDESKKNIIAQVKRTGFKIKDRLLRSAYVLIYI